MSRGKISEYTFLFYIIANRMGKFTDDLSYLYISEAVMTNNLWLFRTELGCLSRKEIIESVNDSLRNLGLEYIDLLIIHKNDPNCPLEGKKQHLSMNKMFTRWYYFMPIHLHQILPSHFKFFRGVESMHIPSRLRKDNVLGYVEMESVWAAWSVS